MKRVLKKWIALGTLAAMIASSSNSLNAQEDIYCADAGGYGYNCCRRSPCLAPAIALGTIALIAIIAVAVQNSSHGHGHCHD